MIYKNGIKEYSLMFFLFGIPMGTFFGFSTLNVLVGIFGGVFSGFLFAFFIFLFIKFQEKKFDKKRVEIAKERKVICDGGATIRGIGGWMFLTEKGIEFYPHKINFSQEELRIPMNLIESVKTNKNQVIINTTQNLTYVIVVCYNKEWKKQIECALASFVKNN